MVGYFSLYVEWGLLNLAYDDDDDDDDESQVSVRSIVVMYVPVSVY